MKVLDLVKFNTEQEAKAYKKNNNYGEKYIIWQEE